MPEKLTCPNCGTDLANGHPDTGCVLGALFTCIADRESGTGTTTQSLMERLARVDECALWDSVGPIIDRLQDGGYDRE